MCGGVSGAGAGGGGAQAAKVAQDRSGPVRPAPQGGEGESASIPPELQEFMQYLQARGVGAS